MPMTMNKYLTADMRMGRAAALMVAQLTWPLYDVDAPVFLLMYITGLGSVMHAEALTIGVLKFQPPRYVPLQLLLSQEVICAEMLLPELSTAHVVLYKQAQKKTCVDIDNPRWRWRSWEARFCYSCSCIKKIPSHEWWRRWIERWLDAWGWDEQWTRRSKPTSKQCGEATTWGERTRVIDVSELYWHTIPVDVVQRPQFILISVSTADNGSAFITTMHLALLPSER